MKISVNKIVTGETNGSNNKQIRETPVELSSPLFNSYESRLKIKGCFAYPPLINSHDHLIGNWFPRTGVSDLYPNAHIWVNDMKESSSVKERDKIWVNSLPMNFYRGNGKLLTQLGCYKNIFSGVGTVQDHAPNQQPEYYDMQPINVLKDYRQCHSLKLENFWGGEDPVTEWKLTGGKMPFILHLGEGLDETVGGEFRQLKELNLLQPNTLIIHGIALKKKEIRECAERGTSICWCPYSNHFLIGETLDIKACLDYGVNVVLGTDSTLSGSVNIFEEMRFAQLSFGDISPQELFRMVSANARRALFLPDEYGKISEKANENILLMRKVAEDPYDNLLLAEPGDIVLLMHQGKPLFGLKKMLDYFDVDERDYYIYRKNMGERLPLSVEQYDKKASKNRQKHSATVSSGTSEEYFVINHPQKIMDKISSILGYQKELPYLHFQLETDVEA